jgi:hypothetical protein
MSAGQSLRGQPSSLARKSAGSSGMPRPVRQREDDALNFGNFSEGVAAHASNGARDRPERFSGIRRETGRPTAKECEAPAKMGAGQPGRGSHIRPCACQIQRGRASSGGLPPEALPFAVTEGSARSSSSNPIPLGHPANHSNSGWRKARSRMELQSMRRGTGGGGRGSSDSAWRDAARPVVPILAARRDLPVDWDSLGDWGSPAGSPMGYAPLSHAFVPPVRGAHWIRREIRHVPCSLPPPAQVRMSLRQDQVRLLRPAR